MRILLGVILTMTLMTARADSAGEFWRNLEALCGKAFEGRLVEAPPGEQAFAGERLVMHVRECTPRQIRIPFVVGEDRSRTWVLTRRGDRIELKHDHRHADGTSDEVTLYGGTTTNTGQATAQYFPADQATREMIEAAFSNVWTIRVDPGNSLTYGLWRLGTPRVFRIDFDLGDPVQPPAAPWGWEASP